MSPHCKLQSESWQCYVRESHRQEEHIADLHSSEHSSILKQGEIAHVYEDMALRASSSFAFIPGIDESFLSEPCSCG